MSNTDIVLAGMSAWSRADWDALSSMVTDDLKFGDSSDPADKNAFLALGRAMLTAFPDWAFNPSGIREEGDKVTLTARITGTHTGTLDPGQDIPTVPATGKRIDLPSEDHAYTLRGGQISQIVITAAPDGGFPAMYAQLGVPLG
jgi:predicted ester cyclase